jgi:hypothetical protein
MGKVTGGDLGAAVEVWIVCWVVLGGCVGVSIDVVVEGWRRDYAYSDGVSVCCGRK